MTETTNQTDPIDPTPNATPTYQNTESKRSLPRALLVSGGAVLAAAVLIGGGVAVGAAIADETDEDGDGDTTTETTQRDDDAAATDDSDADEAIAAVGTASVSELLDIIEIASAEAEGEPIGIEAAAEGAWDVKFATAGGDESEVRVDTDGTAVVTSTEAADQDAQAREGSLDDQTLEALVTAALADTDGTVVDIEIDGDTASPYDVSVLTADRKTVDIALDPEFTVLTADPDDSDD